MAERTIPRNPRVVRFYGTKFWRALRARALAASPACVACKVRLAVVVDHIVPREQGGPDTLANLQTLCRRCDAKKRVAKDGGFGRPVAPPDDPARRLGEPELLES